MSTEKFCLRWNDFEKSISSAFKDIRNNKDFFDVTLACEDEQLQAHKVILSACSPFFQNVLRRHQPQNHQILLYLKGVSYRDMESVLSFMYHGEVNIAQEHLNNFLQVAEDLKVKGLTQENSSESQKETAKKENISNSTYKKESKIIPHRLSKSNEKFDYEDISSSNNDNDVEEIVEYVKSEPREHLPQQSAQNRQPQQQMSMYNEEHQLSSMDLNEEQYQIEEEYGDDLYSDQSYMNQQHGEGIGQQVSGELKSKCDQCDGWFHKRSMARHIERKHSVPISVSCEMCGKKFSSYINLKEHVRRDHGLSTRGNY